VRTNSTYTFDEIMQALVQTNSTYTFDRDNTGACADKLNLHIRQRQYRRLCRQTQPTHSTEIIQALVQTNSTYTFDRDNTGACAD
jgi:hypothetical protein